MIHLQKFGLQVLLVIVFLIMTGTVLAQAPGTLAYQGRLTDSDGGAITGNIAVVFTIYGSADGVDTLWTELIDVTPNGQGVFTAVLGSTVPISSSVFEGSIRYMGIRVDSDSEEMMPRQIITSVPYSRNTGLVPGIAHSYYAYQFPPVPDAAVDTITITVPGPGIVKLQATGYFSILHALGVNDWIRASIDSEAVAVNGTNFAFYWVASTLPVGTYYDNYCINAVVIVPSAGTYTYYLTNGRNSSSESVSSSRSHFTAMYFPTAIGEVDQPNFAKDQIFPGGFLSEEQKR